jgi:lambda family phage portal protein
MKPKTNWIDRAALQVAPKWAMSRIRARMAAELLLRSYEGASIGRRTQGWKRSSTDAVQATGPFIGRLRDVARDLVRNNAYAESILRTIVDHAIGTGIVAKIKDEKARQLWKEWAGTTACDADGLQNFDGLQKLVLRATAQDGEVLIRRRFRRPEDGLPIPLQIQVLEADFLDTTKDTLGGLGTTPRGHRIIQGVQFDAIGRRVGYWIYDEHPGSNFATTTSSFVPASNIIHHFRPDRPGQVRGPSWFAPVLLRFKDFDEFEDATLMKQKIAACLAVIVTDPDGNGAALGTADDTNAPDPGIDSLEPGAIINRGPGSNIEVVQPPTVREYEPYIATQLRAMASGMGVTYEDATGDYTDLPFSAARMSRLRHWANVEDWRWRLVIPRFCDPVYAWFAETADVFGTDAGTVEWTPPPPAMIDPVNEGLAFARNIRAGLHSWSEGIREQGFDPEDVLAEIAAEQKKLDELGIILDSDPRKTTQAGQLQGEAAAETDPDPLEAAAREVRNDRRRGRR